MIKFILFDWYGVMDGFESKYMFELISKLKHQNFKVGVLSNMSGTGKMYLCSLKEVCSLFDYFFTSTELGFNKPSKEIYLKVLEEMNVEPFEVVFIDDNYDNVEGAKKVGMIGIQFESYEKLFRDFERLGINFKKTL